jgi:protein-S-isoprenylcysteine O-methyltransferase Ste14
MTLNARAWIALAVLGLAMGALLFGAAGSVQYWQGWVFLAVFEAASVLVTLELMRRDPALLERRMRGGPTAEQEPTQRIIMLFASAGFVALIVVPGLDHRFGWSTVPIAAVVAGNLLIAVGFYLIALVYRANTFTSATVQVVADQKIVTTGPYAIVRHPMYASAMLYLIGMPLSLGSWWGFAALAAMFPFLVWRLVDEEQLLTRELPGYAEYRSRVRYRLLPLIW